MIEHASAGDKSTTASGSLAPASVSAITAA